MVERLGKDYDFCRYYNNQSKEKGGKEVKKARKTNNIQVNKRVGAQHLLLIISNNGVMYACMFMQACLFI